MIHVINLAKEELSTQIYPTQSGEMIIVSVSNNGNGINLTIPFDTVRKLYSLFKPFCKNI